MKSSIILNQRRLNIKKMEGLTINNEHHDDIIVLSFSFAPSSYSDDHHDTNQLQKPS